MKHVLLAVGLICLVATHALGQRQRALPASPTVRVRMYVVLASGQGKNMDTRVPARMLHHLRRPPYTGYTNYTVLSQIDQTMQLNRPLVVTLPDASKLRLTGKRTSRWMMVKADLKDRRSKSFHPVLQTRVRAQQMFCVPGGKFKRGTLIVGVDVIGD